MKHNTFIQGIFFIMSIFLFTHIMAQTDSTYTNTLHITDTIYIPGDTIVSVDTVVQYVDPPKEHYFFVGITGQAGTIFSNYTTTKPDLYNAGLMNDELVPSLMKSMCLNGYMEYGHWMFNTGIGISSYQEKINHVPFNFFPDSTRTTFIDTLDTWWQIIGNDTFQYHETRVRYKYIDDSVKTGSLKNYHTYLQIPLITSYNIWLKNMDINVSAGIIPQFRISKNQIIFINEHKNLTKADHVFHVFLARFYTSIGVNYFLTDDLILHLKSFYARDINKRLKKEFVYDVNQSTLGIHVGLRYFLFKK